MPETGAIHPIRSRRCAEREFTLRGLVGELAERGVKVDYRSVWNFVPSEKLSFKKTVVARERDRPDVARRRWQRRRHQGRIAPERLVFIDETWTRTNMAPLRGWAPHGQRLRAKDPHGRRIVQYRACRSGQPSMRFGEPDWHTPRSRPRKAQDKSRSCVRQPAHRSPINRRQPALPG
jgi:hypothetical protein